MIFDLDGTLVDSLPGIAASLNHALRKNGFPEHPKKAVRGFIGNGSRILVKRAIPAQSPDALVDAIEADFKVHYDETWSQGTHIYPEISGLLTTLKSQGHPLAILSNKPDPFTRSIVQALFPEVVFAAVIGQRPGIPHKPDPTGALEISTLLNLEPGNCMIIGDSTIDIHTARAAGMKAVSVSWGYHDVPPLLAESPDAMLASPGRLLDLIPGFIQEYRHS